MLVYLPLFCGAYCDKNVIQKGKLQMFALTYEVYLYTYIHHLNNTILELTGLYFSMKLKGCKSVTADTCAVKSQ